MWGVDSSATGKEWHSPEAVQTTFKSFTGQNFFQETIIKASPSPKTVRLQVQMPSGGCSSPSIQACTSCSLLPLVMLNNCDSCPKLRTLIWGTERSSRASPSLSTSSDLTVVSLRNGGAGDGSWSYLHAKRHYEDILTGIPPSLQELEPISSSAPSRCETQASPSSPTVPRVHSELS